MRNAHLLRTLVIVLVLLVLLVPPTATLYVDWLWFDELNYEQVFLRILGTRLELGVISFLIAFAVIGLNLQYARGKSAGRQITLQGLDSLRTITFGTSVPRFLLWVAAALAAVPVALYAAARWDVWLMARNAVPFGTSDPILGFDAGFYVFQLPWLQMLRNIAVAITLLATLGAIIVHALGQSLTLHPVDGLVVHKRARHQLSLLAALLLLLFACSAWLGIPKLMISPGGIVHGAAYADVHARLPMQWVLVAVALIGAALAAWQATQAKYWPLLTAFGLCVGVIVLGNGYAALLQRFVVTPNEQVRETPYIEHSIAASRAGFALDRVVERELSGDARLTGADISRNAATLGNVPLWNDQPLLETFGQIQEIRTYYDFISVDNDRYMIDGEYRQIMLSVREMNTGSLPSASWINERLTFTHGYGLTLGPVNEVTPEGLPVLFIRDLPLVSTVDLKVDRPEIYFGELSNDHVFVHTGTPEFDYPKGNDNVFGSYEGKGGLPIGNFLRRALLALRFGSTDIFFSPSLTSESRILMYRRIAERVKRIAPFLSFDPDPYPAISNGRVMWIQDAYTTSNRYPYSTPSRGGINYIRNSVKATIDAYDGTTVFHLIDEQDPIAATLARVFPTLFQPLASMPEDLRSRMRYPQAIFALQAAMFTTFHMTQPTTFYNREDQWDVPVLDQGSGAQRMAPYYTIMKLPGEQKAEYIQMLPYTPQQKDNLAAWMVARSDGDHYGELMVFSFPKQTVVFGPRQIAARISQDEVIAPQITLWNQQGSEVIQGTLLVIPVEESLIYIRPLYLRAPGGRIPELKRVIVAYRNQIVMEETLDAALARLFPELRGTAGSSARTATPGSAAAASAGEGAMAPAAISPAAGGLAAEARRHYQRALDAQRAGDWARYGEEIRQLGAALERMSAQGGKTSEP